MQVPAAVPALRDDPERRGREQRRRAAGLLAGVTDAHVHLFPLAFYRALWRWFDAHAWHIAFRGDAEATLGVLRDHGTARVVASVFAHKPGAARPLNAFLAGLVRAETGVVGLGTVLPGEPDARAIVREAVGPLGLRGIKLHCHVQKVAIDDPATLHVLELCQELGVPAVVHAGREPASQAYGIDCRALCNVARTERVLQRLPRLRLVVPHIGADEFAGYFGLLAQHEHLYLDTAMACAEYFDPQPAWSDLARWAGRVMYGTDFPVIPYEVDRELHALARNIDDDGAFEALVRGTAARVFGT
ncbi:MAG: amidohydrolase [Myxococcales bacterium]|nr:amidohydrolase [Myxococcales bacterium]